MSTVWSFAPGRYGTRVEKILALDGGGERLMPLASGKCSSPQALQLLKSCTARELFPGSRAPEAAMAGLYLYFSCLDESHTVSQAIETVDGSFWHGIMHRQEPDAGNAAYWFRRVGKHAIFPALGEAAQSLGYATSGAWDPFAFIDACEEARRRHGSEKETLLRKVQTAEWQLLFDHCASVA